MRSNCAARQAGIGRRRAHLAIERRRDGTVRRRPCPTRAGPARRARRCGSARRRGRRRRPPRWRRGIPAPRSGWTAPGTAREGSSRRWLARPTRWISRLAPFGAPTLMTRSTSPQSMPRSSVEVATTALSVPAAMAASTLRRRAGVERAVMQRDRQVVVVDAPQLLEQQLGLAARVDEHQRQAVRLDGGEDLGQRRSASCGRPTAAAASVSSMRMSGRAPPSAVDQVGELHDAVARAAAPGRPAARSAAPRSPTGRCARGPAPASAAGRGRAPAGRRAWSAPGRAARRG